MGGMVSTRSTRGADRVERAPRSTHIEQCGSRLPPGRASGPMPRPLDCGLRREPRKGKELAVMRLTGRGPLLRCHPRWRAENALHAGRRHGADRNARCAEPFDLRRDRAGGGGGLDPA